MPEFFKKLAANPAVRKAFFSLLLALAAAAGYSSAGCSNLTPAQSARVELFECQTLALAPLVDNVLDAEQLVREVYTGQASLGAVLQYLNASPAEVQALVEAFRACEGKNLPEGEPS